MDNVDEKIDTISRSALALTVSCARCHDHKFDPIPATDYYAWPASSQARRIARACGARWAAAGLDYYDPNNRW